MGNDCEFVLAAARGADVVVRFRLMLAGLTDGLAWVRIRTHCTTTQEVVIVRTRMRAKKVEWRENGLVVAVLEVGMDDGYRGRSWLACR